MPVKTLLAALATFAVSAPAAQAQQAAATLPDTVGNRPAAIAAAPATAAPAPSETSVRAEAVLRAQIAAMQAGAPDYNAMTPGLADAVREQEAAVTPLIQGFGALRGIAYAGSENGADLFAVMFEKAATQWVIGLNADGKIGAMLFRPAPEAPTAGE
jgi:hypothetical protein